MRTLKFNVVGQQITADPTCDFTGIVRGTDKYLKLVFNFDSEWVGAKVIKFRSRTKKEGVSCLLQHDSILVPSEATQGLSITFALYCKVGEATIVTDTFSIRQD